MAFSAVLGQSAPISVLRRALASSRVPQAYLFIGPPNVGKTLTAVEFAKAANCERPGEGLPDACDECSTCTRIARLAHPDFRLVRPLVKIQMEAGEGEPDSAQIEGAMITTDQVGNLIADANLKISQAKRKVYVIVGAETMNTTAANRLLKTLEEPPSATTFILTTANASALLPTVISRCQALQFRQVPSELAVPFLQARYRDVDPAVVRSVAALSGGRIGWADHLLAHPGVIAVRDSLLEVAASLPYRRLGEAMVLGETLTTLAEHWWLATEEGEMAEKLLKGNRDRVLRTKMNDLLDVWVAWFRDIALACAGGDTALLINVDRAQQLSDVARAYTGDRARGACEAIDDVKRQLRGNANLRLAAEVLLIKLLQASR
jgi:DNA polymerase-3 subunit delta'